MSVHEINGGVANDTINDNVIQPFQLEESNLRGRLVRLGSVLDDIIEPHNYPQPVSKLVAETVTLALLLSSMLKYEGIFTLQTSSDGPVSMVVADVTTKGHIRACAKFDQSAVDALECKEEKLQSLMGKGYIAFTVDQGAHMERYQGIVELRGDSLQESIDHYFSQSEQIGTGIRMSVGLPNEQNRGWRTGAIMLQHLPDEGEHLDHKDRKVMNFKEDSADMEEDWRRANILLNTCTPEEFLSPSLDGNELLVRLFHEEGVRVYTPQSVIKKCRCSSERTKEVLLTLSHDELEQSAQDNMISMTCEFCSSVFEFSLDDFKEKPIDKKDN